MASTRVGDESVDEPTDVPTDVLAQGDAQSEAKTSPTQLIEPNEVPAVAELALIASGGRRITVPPPPLPTTASSGPTSALDALRDEEIERTRLFIRMGWLLSVIVMVSVPFVDAPPAMSATFCAGLVVGMIVSYFFHRAFADPVKYTERALVTLAIICVINGHIGVLYYGTYSAAPLMVVVGIHFVARTEAERVATWIFITAMSMYTVISMLIISGVINDPGVFASDRPMTRATLATASVFVLGTFVLAYYTARTFRIVSLASIEDLQAATKLASQREALMDELRADLERALAVGGPGRYTEQVVGNYRIGIVLGRGAMGEVYEGTRVDSGEPAAIKLLRRELLADTTQVARFLREVRACGSLESPHVIKVLDASTAESSLPYLAMERLHGTTLAEQFRDDPRLSVPATLELCRHVGAGLDAAAEAGVVHRDLKPQNVMCCDGIWKILDFGVATISGDSGTLTQGGVVGTPHYMAPEQAQGKNVDRRADLYALAAIVYRCATGRHPFHAADTPSLLYAVVHRMPARPSELSDLPPDFDRWCALALAKSPDHRFATGAVLAAALGDAFAGALDAKLRRRADSLIRKFPWEAT